ncbi:MAG TPA: hypothetical protein VK559_11570, partial [Ferruginibacter sp.]|nr:hypothetical protein [Ferruginibacter sp.]
NNKYTPLGGVAGYNAADRIFSIGIGTADNARSNALTVLKNGKVGLGTTTPTEILDVTGNVKFSGALMPNNTAGTAGQVLTSAGPGASPTWAVANASSFNGTNNYVAKFTPTGSAIGNSEIYDNGTFVGIGTTTAPAGYSLAVNGKIIATKLVVQLYGNWPDYVFQNNYKLTPIADLEKYIDQNQHLPGVPSACDIEKSGIDVGANQQILLQKVEELTLYIIDQNKKIEDQDKKIGQLQTQDDEIQQLKKEVDDLKMLLQKSK